MERALEDDGPLLARVIFDRLYGAVVGLQKRQYRAHGKHTLTALGVVEEQRTAALVLAELHLEEGLRPLPARGLHRKPGLERVAGHGDLGLLHDLRQRERRIQHGTDPMLRRCGLARGAHGQRQAENRGQRTCNRTAHDRTSWVRLGGVAGVQPGWAGKVPRISLA
jgi:hypothetical protein